MFPHFNVLCLLTFLNLMELKIGHETHVSGVSFVSCSTEMSLRGFCPVLNISVEKKTGDRNRFKAEENKRTEFRLIPVVVPACGHQRAAADSSSLPGSVTQVSSQGVMKSFIEGSQQ